MDWLYLGLALLVVVGNIEAQQGYNYPKPKTPFPGDTSDNSRLAGSHTSGLSSPRIQQESPNTSQGTFANQQSSNDYPGLEQPGASSGSQGSFGTQPVGGYPSARRLEAPNVTQRPFGTQQSTSYPALGQSTTGSTQTSFGQQPSAGGYSREKQPGAPGVNQIPFGTQQPSTGYPDSGQSVISAPIQRPFGSQQPSSGGYPSSAQSGTPLQSLQPSSYPSAGQAETSSGTQIAFQQPANGYTNGAQARTLKPFGTFSSDTPSGQQGFTRVQNPSTNFLGEQRVGNQQGYSYPTPQRPFTGTSQVGSTIPAVSRPGELEFRTSSFGQTPAVGTTGISQFPSGGERSSGLLNGYPSKSSHPGQQALGGYPQSGRPQGVEFPVGPSKTYPSDSVQGQEKQGRGERKLTNQFPTGEIGYSGSERRFPSDKTQPTTNLGGQEPTKRPAGYAQLDRPTVPQFPSAGSEQTSGNFGRSSFPEKSIESSGQTQVSTGSISGQVANGYPGSTTLNGLQSIFPSVGTPSRPQFPSVSSTSSHDKRPLSSYLPPGQGIVGQPETLTSQFPSRGFTLPTSQGPIGGEPVERKPPGTADQTTRFQNGYGGQKLSGSQFTSTFPAQSTTPSQNGFGGTGTLPLADGKPPQFPSGSGQIQSDLQLGYNGYSRSGKAAQQFGRPGSSGRSEPGYSLNETTQKKFSPQTGSQTPESQQSPGSFVPSERRFSDESTFDEAEEGDYSAIPGQPGRDYPILSDVPETSFSCDAQEFRGYYADVETRCQIFHICANSKTYDFLCPNGTIFHQEYLVCVWWNQFDCNTAPSLYRINEHIYDFSIIGAQQTGGIQVSGQDYQDLPLDRTSDAGVDKYPTSGVQSPEGREGSGYQSRGQEGYENQVPQSDIQRSEAYPSQIQGSTRPNSVGGKAGNGVQESASYPSGRSQQLSESSLKGYPDRTPVGTGVGQTRSGKSQGLGSGHAFEGYPNGRPQGRTELGSTGYSNGKEQRDFQRPETPNGESQTSTGSSFSKYPTRDSERSDSGYPSRDSQSQGYPSENSAISGQISGQYRPVSPSRDASQPTGGYSNLRPQGSGLPSGPIGDGVTFGGQYGTPQNSGSETQRPVPTITSPQKQRGYSTGTTLQPSFSNDQISTRSGSPFPGSPQPHEPTREYLPAV